MQRKNDRHGQQADVKPCEPQIVPPAQYARYPDYQPAEDVHLRDYLGVILKRKWIVLSFLASVLVATVIFTAMMIPVYKSTVVIKIDKQGPDVIPYKNLTDISGDESETQKEILKSRNLAERVIRELNLDKSSGFLPVESKLSAMIGAVTDPIERVIMSAMSFMSTSEKKKHTNPGVQTNDPTKEAVPVYLSNALIARLEVVPVKNSELLKVSFSSNDPEISMTVANAVADQYIGYDLDSRVDAGKEAKEFLEKQIESAKLKVEVSEELLNKYASQNEIIFVDNNKNSVIGTKLGEISSALSAESTARMQKEALYRQIKESGTNNPVILNNGLIQSLRNQYATLQAEYSNLSRTFTPDYPKMKNLKSQLDAIHSSIEREKSNLIKSVESDYRASLKKEAYLKSALEAQKTKVLDFQERAVQYQTLLREVEVNKELHNSLLKKLNEVGVAALSKSTNIQIVDRALYPKRPDKPDKLQNFLLSIIFGLIGGAGLAFLVEYFDNTVKDTGEIENRMRLPSLGMIPFQPQLNAERRPKVISSDVSNPIAEAFRSISTFIMLSSSIKPPKTILVTSPGEKEGKTTICINIASALSESLGKGIIIDADMRRPKLHHSFGVDNKTGLSTCLSGLAEFSGIDGTLIKPTSVPGLDILTAGPMPPNPSRLLHSIRMKYLLEALYDIFNFVIIDAPPLMGMPDSMLLSSIVDGTILVVKAGETPRNAIASAKQIFGSVNSNLLGVVLNGVKMTDLKYGSYSHYFSSYFKE
ncbi:MAG: polysaccharide biosynthesis tyrosine autokinase [Nitrospiraceae bacterium]|nr:polysaccharide biosynthesis tyrosine autokinase [Nitrospiraceae bacterium]